MQAACKEAPQNPDALRAIDLLYNTALISSGYTVSFNFYGIAFPLVLGLRIFCRIEWKTQYWIFIFDVAIQPIIHVEVGGKLYNMMDVELAVRWGTPSSEAANVDAQQPEAKIVDPAEVEIVEPSQVEVEGSASNKQFLRSYILYRGE